MYQQTRLSDTLAIGAPGPAPYVVANWADAELADLDAMKLDPQFGLTGMGFWPVDVTESAFDPTSQVPVPPIACDSVDAAVKRWKATVIARAMTDDEFVIANPVPPSVTNYQARRALRVANLFDKADAAVRGAGNPSFVDAWDYANTFLRDDDVITAMGGALGLTPRQVDDLFRSAEKLL